MYLIVWLLNNRRFYLERKGYSSSPRINYSKSCNSAENRSVRFLRRWATIIIRTLDANCRIYYGTGRVCIWEEDLAFRGRIHPVDYASSVSCCPFSFDFWISRHCCPGRMPPPAPFCVAIRKEIRYRRFVNVKCGHDYEIDFDFSPSVFVIFLVSVWRSDIYSNLFWNVTKCSDGWESCCNFGFC